jgi:protein gp37
VGENSKIEWTDHTFNPWMGCTKVSPACDGCYAEALMDLRYGKVQWGPHGERVRTAPANWKQPIKWDKQAAAAGTRPRVFCASLADVFDNQVPLEWRADLFALIRATPNLIWLLLTKRPQNIIKMVAAIDGGLPPNAALGTSVEDQVRFDLNVPALRNAKRMVTPAFAFLSCEPLLGPLVGDLSDIDWVIAGGETDQGQHKARPADAAWYRSLRDQCAVVSIAFHFKQWGSIIPDVEREGRYRRVQKSVAGRLLDGVEHNGFPEITGEART